MAITIYTSGRAVPHKSFSFSAGEMQVRIESLDSWESVESIEIEANVQSSQDAMELFMVLNALDNLQLRYPSLNIRLPYLPYSRQDRVCYPGEAFGLEAFLNLLITSLPHNVQRPRLTTWDVHSGVAGEICQYPKRLSFYNLPPHSLLTTHFRELLAPKADELVVVAPDKGAVKRATLVAESLISLDTPERILFGEKVRDPGSGEILGTLVLTRMGETFTHLTPDKLAPFPLKGKPMLIVDDICDGGRTFIELAKVLREFEPSEIILYVTHGIFSRGFEVFKDQNGKPLIDQFLIANPFKRCLDWVAVDGVKFISDPTKTSFICLEFP